MKNHYKILGIQESATEEEIKKAYKRLVFRYHPDRNFGRKEQEKQFREIQDAYEVLSDARRKTYYDAKINNAKPNPYFDLRREKEYFISNLRVQEQSENLAIKEQNQTLIYSAAALGVAVGIGYGSCDSYQKNNDSVGDLFLGLTLFTAAVGGAYIRRALKKKKGHQQRKKELEKLIEIFSGNYRK